MVERLPCTQKVIGSIPVTSTSFRILLAKPVKGLAFFYLYTGSKMKPRLALSQNVSGKDLELENRRLLSLNEDFSGEY